MRGLGAGEPESGRKGRRARLYRLVWLLDSSIRLPGGFTIGLDGILGLIPGVGDMIAAGMSCYIIAAAARLRVPGVVLLRMGLNVVLDLLLGAIPFVGDVFDFAFKANERNIRLLDAHLDETTRTRARSRWIAVGVVGALVLLLGFALAIFMSLVRVLWVTVTG